MNLKIITPEEVKFRKFTEAFIRFNRAGLITLSATLRRKLELKSNDNVSFIFDEDTRQYIGRSPKGNSGFTVYDDKCKGNTNYLKFNAIGLLKKVFKNLELPVPDASSHSRSFRVDIHNPVVHFAITLYRMI